MADENASNVNSDQYGRYIENIKKLKDVMENAKESAKQNKTFRETLKTKIKEITELIKTLEDLIDDFINSKNDNEEKIKGKKDEMDALQKKIDDCETKLAAVTAERDTLSNKAPEEVKDTSELEGKLAGLEKDVEKYLAEIDECKKELDNRSKQVLQLQKILEDQYNTIEEVTTYLSDFSSDGQYEDNNLDLDGLTKIIEKLKEMIAKVQSSPEVDAVSAVQPSAPAVSAAITNSNNPQTGETKTTTQSPQDVSVGGLSYRDIKNGLSRKATQEETNTGRADNKYKLAFRDLIKSEKNNQISEQNIIDILKKNTIQIKNKSIMGGRKTRKNKQSRITKKRHKKQKGGYFYNKHLHTSKRRKISSNLYKSRRRSSKSNNTRSS